MENPSQIVQLNLIGTCNLNFHSLSAIHFQFLIFLRIVRTGNSFLLTSGIPKNHKFCEFMSTTKLNLNVQKSINFLQACADLAQPEIKNPHLSSSKSS